MTDLPLLPRGIRCCAGYYSRNGDVISPEWTADELRAIVAHVDARTKQNTAATSADAFTPNARVVHVTLGAGTVISSTTERIVINFDGLGPRELLTAFCVGRLALAVP